MVVYTCIWQVQAPNQSCGNMLLCSISDMNLARLFKNGFQTSQTLVLVQKTIKTLNASSFQASLNCWYGHMLHDTTVDLLVGHNLALWAKILQANVLDLC